MPGDGDTVARDRTYRVLQPTDAGAYRDVRLRALQSSPEAFGAAFEDEQGKGHNEIARANERNHIIGCWSDDAGLLGTAGLFLRQGLKLRHKAVMFGLFVAPERRQEGIGCALVEAAIVYARTVAEALQLSVATSSVAALALYRSRGFHEYGLERRALKLREGYADEYLMELDLHAH